MKGPAGFGNLVNIFMNIIMGLCISIVIFIAIGAPLMPDSIIAAWFVSFVIGYTAGAIAPVATWGMKLARALHIKNGFVAYLFSAIISGLYFGIIILFGNSLVNSLASLGWPAVIGFFTANIGLVALSAIALVFVFMKPCQILAAAISGFNPAKMTASESH